MKIHVLTPAEAPPGIQRLLPVLQNSLSAPAYSTCRIIVAFARLSGVVRLLPQIRAWRARGNAIEAIVGIDRFGTSREALQVLLDELNAVFVTRTPDESCTFHPKFYLFEGGHRARAIVGSHNLTSGGLETNFEGGVIVDLRLPDDDAQWKSFRDAWDQLLPKVNPSTRRLDVALLDGLIKAGLLLPEVRIARASRAAGSKEQGPAIFAPDIFPAIAPAPPSPLPKDFVPGLRLPSVAKKKPAKPVAGEQRNIIEGLPRALVIEIIPHHNGEIFLSKKAADAFPAFFGMPFPGRTAPKVAGNPGYPMRGPDPLVEWRLYDKKGKLMRRSQFALNTVLYEKKSEIRITVTPSLAKAMPEYSVMVMWGGSSPLPTGLDYVIDAFVPGSPGQKKWEPVLNVTLPGGGRAHPRRMGWI
ncbi:MAG: phospholipase D-like domain-containing protein [Chromatiales bacterium]